LRQEIVLEALSNPYKGKQTELTLNLHSSITIGTKHKPQRHKQDKLEHTKQTPSSTNNQTFCLSPFFPQTIRIKKEKRHLI